MRMGCEEEGKVCKMRFFFPLVRIRCLVIIFKVGNRGIGIAWGRTMSSV